jgi:DNA (cytosine-5)-methyltransferase 1
MNGGGIMLKGASMFSSAGVGETYFKKAGIDIVVANELLPKRGKFYQEMYPTSKMIVGDIRNKKTKDDFIELIHDDVKFLVATPPCQGISNLGKNRNLYDKLKDSRNYLVFDILDVIDKKDFDYIMIENVPGFLKILLPYKNELKSVIEILEDKYSKKYIIESKILNAKDYGVPQSRPRAIIKMFKKKLRWPWPKQEKEITLKDVIWDLPSLESGEKSNIKFHNAREHLDTHILWMKHTPTGCSAHDNIKYYPVKKDGERIKGFNATYKRMRWDAPAPAVTMRSDAISSQENVHPGRKLSDGTYSDARVLTLRELFIISSLPAEWNIPTWATDTFLRQIIGEAVPPMLSYNIVKGIGKND